MTQVMYDESTDSLVLPQKTLSFYDIVSIVEALIFAAPEPLDLQTIHQAIIEKTPDLNIQEIKDCLAYLETSYQDPTRQLGRGFELVRNSGLYSFRTVTYVKEYVQSYLQDKPQRLTPAQLEVLSIMAYRQPITKYQVEEIRGVDCSSSMKRLLTLKLIKILGKAEGIGKPLLYGTSKEFLELFNLNSLRDLPTLQEYHELDKDEEKTLIHDSGTVNIQDLFGSSDLLQSEETLKSSKEALASLDKALLGIVQANKNLVTDELDEEEESSA